MTVRVAAVAVYVIATALLSADAAHAQGAGPLLSAAQREVARLSVDGALGAQAPGGHWIARHPVAAGALAGTVAGLALSRVDAIGGANHDPRVAFIGTGVGAWGGLVASAVQQSRRGRRVGRGTKIGIAAGAVALVVVPWLACYGAGGCGGVS